MRLEKGSFEMMKQINQQFILQQIRNNGPISRADIAKQTQLTPPTVSKIVMELLEAGFVQETEIGESSGGRRPILLSINPGGGYVVGLAITAEEIEGLVANLDFQPRARLRQPLHSIDPTEVCQQAVELVQTIIKESGLLRQNLLGVGVALHGLVDHAAGVSIFAPHLQWSHWPVKQFLEAQLGIPVLIDNDVRLMAAGEMWRGAAQGCQNFAYINLDYSVGTGIVLDGQLLRGVNHAAGEIGHIQVEPDGPLCHCGKHGCLETLISTGALQGLERDRVRQIVATYLGRGIAAMIQLLDLRKVLLGGRALSLDPDIPAALKAQLTSLLRAETCSGVEITAGQLGGDASITGAIAMVLTDFYQGGQNK